MIRSLRQLIERRLPWWDPEQAVKRDARTEQAIQSVERLAGSTAKPLPTRLRSYSDYRHGR